MTDEEKVAKLKIMTNEDNEDVINTYLELAASKIIAKAYPYDDSVSEVPAKYETLQLELATYYIKKRGAEGQVTHSENGIQRQYENADVPVSMLQTIVPFCGVIKSGDDGN